MSPKAEEVLEKVQNSQNHEDAVRIIDEALEEAESMGRDNGYDEGFSDGEQSVTETV